MSTQASMVWFCKIEGDEIGPFSATQISEMAATGKLGPTDLVRRGDMDKWSTAIRLRGMVFGKANDVQTALSNENDDVEKVRSEQLILRNPPEKTTDRLTTNQPASNASESGDKEADPVVPRILNLSPISPNIGRTGRVASKTESDVCVAKASTSEQLQEIALGILRRGEKLLILAGHELRETSDAVGTILSRTFRYLWLISKSHSLQKATVKSQERLADVLVSKSTGDAKILTRIAELEEMREVLVLKQANACSSELDFRSAAATRPAGLV